VEIVGPELRLRVKAWETDPAVLVAVMVKVYGEPAVVAGGAAVMSPAAFINATPEGSEPAVMLKVGAGEPVAVTWKVAAFPAMKVVLAALVNTGGWGGRLTVSEKGWVATGSTPFEALTVNV
jgi:hypothetical protein